MSKFTPGKWKVYHDVFRPELSDKTITEVQREDGKAIISWSGFDGSGVPAKERLANARLIATSPRLFNALKKLCEAVDSCPELIPEVMLEAREALKGAEGK
jgi:hypothetical protein